MNNITLFHVRSKVLHLKYTKIYKYFTEHATQFEIHAFEKRHKLYLSTKQIVVNNKTSARCYFGLPY